MIVNPFGELIDFVDGVAHPVDGIVKDSRIYFEELPMEFLFTFEYREQ